MSICRSRRRHFDNCVTIVVINLFIYFYFLFFVVFGIFSFFLFFWLDDVVSYLSPGVRKSYRRKMTSSAQLDSDPIRFVSFRFGSFRCLPPRCCRRLLTVVNQASMNHRHLAVRVLDVVVVAIAIVIGIVIVIASAFVFVLLISH